MSIMKAMGLVVWDRKSKKKNVFLKNIFVQFSQDLENNFTGDVYVKNVDRQIKTHDDKQ